MNGESLEIYQLLILKMLDEAIEEKFRIDIAATKVIKI
jgi:hypothetical protein